MGISIKSPRPERDEFARQTSFKRSRFSPPGETSPQVLAPESNGLEHWAAVKLQKVYKSFRTRRQLADCAVLVEQRWWKLLDFALLKRSSVSFFNIEKQESAVSRWSRARTRAAKVGKGLSKNGKAQKLALQHWLEAIDPRHRYGHNLHFYYVCWLQCSSKQPFFYWLDVGEGKEVDLEEHCPRWKLQQQCIKYLGPKERELYEVIPEDGKLLYNKSRQLLDTSGGLRDTKWIFVLSTSKTLYVGQKKKGFFQHSSFLAGGAASAAGRLVVENGVLKAVWPHSGHYRPTEENFQEFMSFLKENNVDLTNVKKSPDEHDEEDGIQLRSNTGLTSNGSEDDLTKKSLSEKIAARTERTGPPEGLANGDIPEGAFKLDKQEEKEGNSDEEPENESKKKRQFDSSRLDLSNVMSNNVVDNEEAADESSSYMFCKQNLFPEESGEEEEASIPKQMILNRMSSRKLLNSYQLAKKLSFKWTTGAGPRIGCVRNYPSQLQLRALEQVNLSPSGTDGSRCFSPSHNPASLYKKKPEMSSTSEEMQWQQNTSDSVR